MLQPRSFMPWRQCLLISHLYGPHVHNPAFSTSRQLLAGGSSNSPSTIFVPAAPSSARPSFKDSPIRGPDRVLGDPKTSQPNLSIDNYASRVLPPTGVRSG